MRLGDIIARLEEVQARHGGSIDVQSISIDVAYSEDYMRKHEAVRVLINDEGICKASGAKEKTVRSDSGMGIRFLHHYKDMGDGVTATYCEIAKEGDDAA